MKRVSPEDQQIPELPPEIWHIVITQHCSIINSQTLGAVFLLNKTISTYLRENSEAIQMRWHACQFQKLASRESRRYGIFNWFRCSCGSLAIQTNIYHDSFCDKCEEKRSNYMKVDTIITKIIRREVIPLNAL